MPQNTVIMICGRGVVVPNFFFTSTDFWAYCIEVVFFSIKGLLGILHSGFFYI